MEIETLANVGEVYRKQNEPVTKTGSLSPEPVSTGFPESTDGLGASAKVLYMQAGMPSVDDKRAEEDGTDKGNVKKEHQPSEATIDDAVKNANRRMERTRCEYSYHKETNRVSIKVFNADTDEVIREIPPEKTLNMLQKMWELAGILVDEKR